MRIPLSELLLLPKEWVSVRLNGKIVTDWRSLSEEDPFEVRVRLLGGKGGFGSLLRSFGSQFYKSTNQDMCRDLSGRRLKSKKDEERLKKYIELLRERRNRKRKQEDIRAKRLSKLPKHNFDDPEYDRTKQTILAETDSAVEEGLRKVKNQQSVEETYPSTSKASCVHDSNLAAPAKALKLKDSALWLGLDDIDVLDSSGDSDSGEAVLLLFVNIVCSSKYLVHINEENWPQILEKEWMIEFHAPWCPACKDLGKAWSSFAQWSKDLNIKVADVDVTANPGWTIVAILCFLALRQIALGLSGRFLVTALPTIFHVKDGVFRIYNGPRDKEDFIAFVEKKKWTIIDPLPSWKHPSSIQMSVVSHFFRLSMAVRDLHVTLIEKYGFAPWMSYTLFGAVTLFLGCVLGFFIVFVIDRVFPTTLSGDTSKQQPKAKSKRRKSSKTSGGKTSDKSSADSAGHSDGEVAPPIDENVRHRTKKSSSKTD
ncbi:thioredoxin [Trichuris suis]|nr:thioredoxin [Trichuris suis]